VSDDEDDTHPNVDTPSLFKWRHEARLQREEEERQEKAKRQAQIKLFDFILKWLFSLFQAWRGEEEKVGGLESGMLRWLFNDLQKVGEIPEVVKEIETLDAQEKAFKEKEAELARIEKVAFPSYLVV
jgi:hypothetical protein